MGVVRNRKGIMVLKYRGQALVEYILLFAVISAIVMAVFKSNLFVNFFGPNGTFAENFKKDLEYNFRHAGPGRIGLGDQGNEINYTNGSHPSYYNQAKGSTHFFGPAEPYPGI
jgi:hypothetical protein